MDAMNQLYPGEEMRRGAGFPQLAYYRPGDPLRPLVVFLPGGGHLARVAYGHPQGRKQDFLDYWLKEMGYGLLALSYPCDHPVFETLHPEMTITDWGNSAAEIARQIVSEYGLGPRVVLMGWSLGGRAARNFTLAAKRLSLAVDAFISLAAAPPLPGSGVLDPASLTYTDEGLWSVMTPGSSLERERMAAIAAQNAVNGRQVLSFEHYVRNYCANTPIQLRGERHRVKGGRRFNSEGDAAEDQGSFRFADYPLTGAIVPTLQADARHALTDALTWSYLNSQKIYYGLLKSRLDEGPLLSSDKWRSLRELFAGLPVRLSREVSGGHYFFLGEIGARQTINQMASLLEEIAALESEIGALTR